MFAAPTTDSILDSLSAIAKESGDGQFTIRVSARRQGVLVPTLLAAFRDGSLEHVVNAEGWLAKLVGGGEYQLTVSHVVAPAKRYGPLPVNIPGAPFGTPNIAAITSGDWTGPTQLSYPEPQSFAAPPPPTATTAQSFGQTISIPRSSTAGVPMTGGVAQVAGQLGAQDAEKLLMLQREENRIRSELTAKEAELSRKEMEAKLGRDAAERDEKMRRELQLQLATMKPEKSGPGAMEIVSALSGALAPILGAFIHSSQEQRKAQMEMQQRQMEMQLSAQQRQAEMMQAIMLKMGEKPNGSPELTAMLEMSKAQSEAQGAMMTRIVEAMGVVSKTSVAMIETVAEFSAPPEGSPVLDAVKEGTKALMALSQGAQAGARRSIATQTALPAHAAHRQQQAQQQQVIAQQAQAQQLAAARQAAQQPRPVPVSAAVAAHTQPAPAPEQATPTQAPVEVVAVADAPQPNMPPAFDGLNDVPNGFGHIESSVERLEAMIRAFHEPVDEVANYFIDSLKTHEMRVALDEVEGDPSALIAERLGAWCLGGDAQEYLQRLGEAVERIGVERGVMEEGEGDEEDEASSS